MPGLISNYARLISEKKILFVPSCLVIEMMAAFHSGLVRLPRTGRLTESDLFEILTMLSRLANDLRCTRTAYESGRVNMFVGDWKQDRLKAEKVFAILMESLCWVYNRSFQPFRDRIRENLVELKERWEKLYALLDAKSADCAKDKSCAIRYFHCSDSASWQKTMAQIILSVDDESVYESADAYLLLLCYTRLKTLLVRQIEDLQKRANTKKRFSEDKILCVSEGGGRMTCPMCMLFTDEMVKTKKSTALGLNSKNTTHYGAFCRLS